MSQIGTFTKAADGIHRGRIRTLLFNADIEIRPIGQPKAASRLAPSHLVYAGELNVGAAWSRNSEEGQPYLSVKLDDPTLLAPIHITLIRGPAEGELIATWVRPG
ncbi:MAG: DUF736 domain-containing protein, partial [Acetobacteraceae bacterium]